MSDPSTAHTPQPDTRPGTWPLVVGLTILAVIILKSAWLSEDSYISFRAIDHFVEGLGLRWNVDERVQVFTNPLWVFVISAFYAVTGEFVVTVTLLALVTSLGAGWLALPGMASSRAAWWAGLAVLVSSRAWIDYSTSGLENPMTFLMLAAFLVAAFREAGPSRRLPWVVLFGSLCALNRLDTMLLTGPLILVVLWQSLRDQARPGYLVMFGQLILASLPLWGWIVFSTIYYGFPLPNTYYAKLATGIPKSEYYAQGLHYFANSLRADPGTLVIILGGLGLVLTRRRLLPSAAAIGVVLYLWYILSVGGDFMRGRFFAAPLFVMVLLLVRERFSHRVWYGLAAVVLILGLITPRPPLFYHPWQGVDWATIDPARDYEEILETIGEDEGIVDERAFVYRSTGLVPLLLQGRITPRHPFVGKGRSLAEGEERVAVFGNTGFAGLYAGSDVHIIDDMGLCDALMARLPMAASEREKWRVGHYRREVPAGYVETIRSGENRIEDERIAELYDSLRLITRGKIWSPERWREIQRWNRGHYQPVIEALTPSP